MSNIQQAIELLNTEKVALENKIEGIKSAIQLLDGYKVNHAVEKDEVPLVQVTETVDAPVAQTLPDDKLQKQFEGYPTEGKHRDKVRFMLKCFDRAVAATELEPIIKIMEGNFAQGTLDVFERTLRGMAHPKFGEILPFQIEGCKTRFYSMPEWLNEERSKVLPNKMPIPNDLNKLNSQLLVNPIFRFKKVE